MKTTSQARDGRDRGMALVERNAGKKFRIEATQFVRNYLSDGRHEVGEIIVDAAKEAGIKPHNDKAFGPVFMMMSRSGEIIRVGFKPRRKGHLAPGASIWRLA